jgi:hypothetical protein
MTLSMKTLNAKALMHNVLYNTYYGQQNAHM